MPRYLVEVPHENTKEACERAVQTFMLTGSHFMTNADWGCSDDEHKAWIIVEMDSKQDVIGILPPLFRKDAKIITLERFSPQATGEIVEQHED